MATERKLDIFRVLAAADKKDAKFYASLTEDEQKALQPFLVMRWMTGTSNALQVILVNEVINPYAFSLTNHKELLWKLLTICNVGKKQRYSWLKLPAKATSSKPVANKVVRQMYNYSTTEANDALRVLSRDDVLSMAADLGLQPDDIAKLKRELKDDSGESSGKRGKKDANSDDLLGF
jgi:hypothetical protein